jgi:hypothetical protein
VGNDTPTESELPNGNLAVTIWHDYMEKLHIGLTPQSFDLESYIVPEVNESLTELSDSELEIGDISLESLWDNDIDADTNTTGTDEEANITGGDADAQITGGDADANITGGDADAY